MMKGNPLRYRESWVWVECVTGILAYRFLLANTTTK